eukprot:6104637-Prymnesium_polylepis.1
MGRRSGRRQAKIDLQSRTIRHECICPHAHVLAGSHLVGMEAGAMLAKGVAAVKRVIVAAKKAAVAARAVVAVKRVIVAAKKAAPAAAKAAAARAEA